MSTNEYEFVFQKEKKIQRSQISISDSAILHPYMCTVWHLDTSRTSAAAATVVVIVAVPALPNQLWLISMPLHKSSRVGDLFWWNVIYIY